MKEDKKGLKATNFQAEHQSLIGSVPLTGAILIKYKISCKTNILISQAPYLGVIMSNDRMVYRRNDGTWVNKKNDSDRASSVHDTQAAAVQAARQNLIHQGGGELITKGMDGKIRSKDTIAPGNDPCPPRDKEH